ncbi:unnamed protein product [Malus baccata var. baccata]
MEDPNKHLKEFEVVYSSMTPLNVDGSIMKMKAFPFSLLEKAKDWLYELTPGTITSWESMKRAFLEKFFPTSRVILLRKRISGIQQNQGLLPIEHQMLDASGGGALVDKIPMAAKTLIANRALNAQQYEGVRQRDNPRQQQVNEVVEKPKEQSVAACGVCSMNGHLTDKCPQLIKNGGWESANTVGEIIQISNGGNPNKSNNKVHSDSNVPDSIKGRMHSYNPKHNLPKITQLLTTLAKGQENQAKDMHNYTKEVQNQAREVTKLKRQMGQMAEFMGQFSREPGKLPSSTDVNPNEGFESAKTITLRRGKEVGSDPSPSKSNQKGDEKMQSKEKEQGLPLARIEQSLPQPPTHPNSATKGKLGSNSMTSNSIPTNAFPRRFMQSKKHESDKDILATFRKVQVNIPLLDAIKQVRKYAKFLKEEGFEQRGGKGNTRFESAMLDLGASINVMPYSIYASMNLGELKNDGVIIQLADRSNAYPKGVLEDVLVHVNHLVFPADFYVLEMEDSNHSPQLPILLCRPFIKTACTKIDVFKGTLTMEVDGEVIDFNISDAMRYPHDGHFCFSIDVIGSWAQEFLDDLSEDALEKTLTQSIGLKNEGLALRHAHSNNKEHFAVPIQEELVEMIAALESNPRHIGYNQIVIAPDDQEKTTFTCPFGTFAYRRMPFGLCNAPATFQRCMVSIFSEFVEKIIEVFMDDFSVFGDSFDACLNNLTLILQRCIETNLVLNWEKCHFMVKQGIVLGHIISEKGIEVDKSKIELVRHLPSPTSVREVRSFLGHAGFYRRFIKDFSKITQPFCRLLRKEVAFEFNKECDTAFKTLKDMLTSALIIMPPDWSLPFELMCDASDYAIGAVLGQRRNKQPHVIHYASRTLNNAQLNYSTTEKELLAVVFALGKFRSYLLGSKVIVYSNHAALKYLLTKKEAKPRLIRWITSKVQH